MKKAIDKGWVKVNGTVAQTATVLKGGEKIELRVPQQNRPTIELNAEILYEDDFIAVVNKPAGIEVSGNKKRTLENALPSLLSSSSQKDALRFPQAAHRLDYATTGAILVAKTRKASVKLNKLFEAGKIEKRYVAVTIGEMKCDGLIESPIDGKHSSTEYSVVDTVVSERFDCLNLVDVKLNTGRRNQIRIHFSELGNPILGDKKYGKEGLVLSGKGLYLHARSLVFKHPFTDEQLVVETSLPKKYRKLFPTAKFA